MFSFRVFSVWTQKRDGRRRRGGMSRASERENEREKPCTAYTEGVDDEMRRMAMGGNG
jgi:hypothetical protein